MKKTIFAGSGVAIITPFNEDMSINYDELEKLIEFQIANGTDAIISCGTTGESATMSEEEHLNVVDFTIKKVGKRVPVIASAGSNDTMFSIELAKESEKLGADGLLLVTPYYNKTSQKGLIESFNAVADSTKVPCIVYNVPSRTGLNIQPKTYLELSKHPGIVGVKEANGNISALAETMSLCGDDLDIYSGEDILTLPVLAMGGKGVISVFANALPNEMHQLCAYVFEGKLDEARALSNKYTELMNAFFMDVNPIPIKEALNLMGYHAGKCRLPLTDMYDYDKDKMKLILQKYNII